MGCSPHPWRVAQTGDYRGPANRRQIHGPPTWACLWAKVDSFLAQSPRTNGFGGFSHGAHPQLPSSLCFRSPVARSSPGPPLQRHGHAIDWLDRPATARGLRVYFSPEVPPEGPGQHLGLGVRPLRLGSGPRNTTHCASFALAVPVCGAVNRLGPARVSRPRHCA